MKKGDAIRIATFGTSFDGLEGIVIATPVSATAKVWVEVNGYRMEMDRANLVLVSNDGDESFEGANEMASTDNRAVWAELGRLVSSGMSEDEAVELLQNALCDDHVMAYLAVTITPCESDYMVDPELAADIMDGDESFESIERVLRPGMGQFAITYRVEVGSRETAVHLVNAYSHDGAATEGDRLFGSRMIDVERCM